MLDIERKFLVRDGIFKTQAKSKHEIRHGYIGLPDKSAARITIMDNAASINIKTIGILARNEYNVEIPLEDAEHLLEIFCKRVIYKTRYVVPVGNTIWNVDEYHGNDNGLIIAEVDLENDTEQFDKPGWLDKEVTNNSYYYCSTIAYEPYKEKVKKDEEVKSYEDWRDSICKL